MIHTRMESSRSGETKCFKSDSGSENFSGSNGCRASTNRGDFTDTWILYFPIRPAPQGSKNTTTTTPILSYEKEYSGFYAAEDTFPRSSGIVRTLGRINQPGLIMHSQGAYFTGDFKYEEKPGDFTGVDFETCRWYNRNLRIFRNIQRITDDPRDRIPVIIGVGHLGLLNYFFQCSPEYEWVSPSDYLK